MSKTAAPKFPTLDAEIFVVAQKRNLEALTSASQIMADGVRAYSQRQAEIVQAAINELVAASEGMFKNGLPEVKPVGEQVGQAKAAYERAIANAEELANIARKAQSEAMGVLGDCALANLEAFKKVAA